MAKREADDTQLNEATAAAATHRPPGRTISRGPTKEKRQGEVGEL